VITLLTGVIAGIAPALYETRRLQTNPLRVLSGSDRVRQRWRNALVVMEITVTVALLVETAAMVDGYQRTRAARLGYDTGPLLNARVENPKGVPVPEVLEVFENLPGVAAAAAATNAPFFRNNPRIRVSAEAAGSSEVVGQRVAVTSGFFSTLGVPMRAGRPFSEHDAGSVAIVNEPLAQRLFLFPTGRDPVGSRIWIAQTSYDVIGVVAGYASNPLRPEDLDPKVFVPLAPRSSAQTRVYFLIRTKGDPAALTQTLRREARTPSAGSIVVDAFTAEQFFDIAGQEILIGTAPLFPLIAIGMLLTAAGIYGVLAFAITRRSRELAVRVAIGASGTDLVRLVSGQSLRLVALGVALGIFLTFGLSRIVRARGGAGSLWDPQANAFLIPVIVVLAIGALATWIPARRALKINPADLLRTT
jgi:hypothetical protein